MVSELVVHHKSKVDLTKSESILVQIVGVKVMFEFMLRNQDWMGRKDIVCEDLYKF